MPVTAARISFRLREAESLRIGAEGLKSPYLPFTPPGSSIQTQISTSNTASMTSRALSTNNFLYPEPSKEDSVQEDTNPRGRHSTVYDAVAGTIQQTSIHHRLTTIYAEIPLTFYKGRISAAGFIPKQVIISSTRDTASSSTNAVPPEAVLFRRKNAPTRFMESDIYFANERNLRTDLPESDLLKALHCYASDFYSRETADDGTGDYQSMDGTALIALGILMEEAARDTLGHAGDLVFTEGEEVKQSPRKNLRAASTASDSASVRPSKKRRRILEG